MAHELSLDFTFLKGCKEKKKPPKHQKQKHRGTCDRGHMWPKSKITWLFSEKSCRPTSSAVVLNPEALETFLRLSRTLDH